MADKITKQELKQPDKLQVMFADVTMYLAKRKKEMAIASGIVVFLILASAGWYFYNQNKEKTALSQYNTATTEYFKARTEGKDLTATAKRFAEIAKQYGGTRAAAFSLYRLGNIYLSLNNPDGAIKAYQDYLNDEAAEDEFRVLVYNGLGSCYEAKKDYKNALGSFEKAANSKAGLNFESTNYANMGRVYEAMNDPKKAVEFYKKAMEKATESSTKELLNRKISSLG